MLQVNTTKHYRDSRQNKIMHNQLFLQSQIIGWQSLHPQLHAKQTPKKKYKKNKRIKILKYKKINKGISKEKHICLALVKHLRAGAELQGTYYPTKQKKIYCSIQWLGFYFQKKKHYKNPIKNFWGFVYIFYDPTNLVLIPELTSEA